MMKVINLVLLSTVLLYAGHLYASDVLTEDNEYTISTHNLLDISVYDEKELSVTVRVAPDGAITYPFVGHIQVAGLTAKELEDKLTDILGRDYLVNPQVRVFIKEYSKVYVIGPVKTPGAYELRSGLTAVGVIAMAGGLTDIARGNGTRVIRKRGGTTETIPVPVDDILERGDKSQDVVLQPDDTVSVPESAF
jgi:polysaccharide export outer membrane protein